MSKYKKIVLSLALAGGLLFGAGLTGYHHPAAQASSSTSRKRKLRPTFFIHGYSSSIKAEEYFAKAAEQSGASKQIIKAQVDAAGKVKLSASLSAKAKNPLILVGFADNRNLDYNRDAWYAYQAIKAVEKTHRFTQMNLIGHSMGNTTISYMLINYGRRKSFPTVKRMVGIAGHYNGVRGQGLKTSADRKNGRPLKMSETYRHLLVLRKIFPKARVLNIYGDLLDGSNSDGRINNSSTRSLRYLVSPRAKSYREKKFTGPNAQHSRLRENPAVLKTAIRFLWPGN
ncbi:alpha/beta hydrolase [Lactobacillus nasalidis]|uniref:Alpha/beta hydrolase n=1 Tax=Lactobacillus nasalidis TaxID=2797258 RepID=A0ABQ3W4G4_9LACO|nr:alpha/beta hydrolase [Lactobacillus nasalidis]GHV97130.1 alpha/beta hydrolase [Lactobacillus nasalidis]GHV99117.1 alpha/beta hydrolase [Lactobacillus nasalidis]GHW01411.1 alpha/beta hydrolase [Lactobacillus nasalidis]